MALSDLHQRWNLGRSFSASVALHLFVISMILAFVPSRNSLEPTEDNVVSVEIVAPTQLEMVHPGEAEKQRVLPTAPKEGPVANTDSDVEYKPAPADQTIETPKSEMIRATKLYAATKLAAPRSTKAQAALRKLGTQEKMIQLCNMEAMEQIARWDQQYRPEYVVAYAMSDPLLSADSVEAHGAAFRSRKHWYNLEFKCSVTPDVASVTTFAFLVEKEIPKVEWSDHNLTPDDGPDD